MYLQHSPRNFLNIVEQCRWQVELQAQCPVWSSLSRFGSCEGQSDGSGIVSESGTDYQRCTGAIYDFTLGFHHWFGKGAADWLHCWLDSCAIRVLMLRVSKPVSAVLFFIMWCFEMFSNRKLHCFFGESAAARFDLGKECVICVPFQTTAFCLYPQSPSKSAKICPTCTRTLRTQQSKDDSAK